MKNVLSNVELALLSVVVLIAKLLPARQTERHAV